MVAILTPHQRLRTLSHRLLPLHRMLPIRECSCLSTLCLHNRIRLLQVPIHTPSIIFRDVHRRGDEVTSVAIAPQMLRKWESYCAWGWDLIIYFAPGVDPEITAGFLGTSRVVMGCETRGETGGGLFGGWLGI